MKNDVADRYGKINEDEAMLYYSLIHFEGDKEIFRSIYNADKE